MEKFYREMKSFRIEHNCNLDVRALLDEKFPRILNPLKHAKVGTFTSVLTAQDAFDYFEKAVGPTTCRTRSPWTTSGLYLIVNIPQNKVEPRSISPSVKQTCTRLKVQGLVTSPREQ